MSYEQELINSKTLLLKIVDILKADVDHEGTDAVMKPSDLLNRIVGLSSELGLEEIRERALGHKTS
jgi:hypothetical protein